MSTSEDMKYHSAPGHGHGNGHGHGQYVGQRYMQSPRYLPLREAFETEIENQESRNEGTMLSEAVVPALDGFPDVKEFDQLMQRYVGAGQQCQWQCGQNIQTNPCPLNKGVFQIIGSFNFAATSMISP